MHKFSSNIGAILFITILNKNHFNVQIQHKMHCQLPSSDTFCIIFYTFFPIVPFNNVLKVLYNIFLFTFDKIVSKFPFFRISIYTMQKKVIIGINTLSVFSLKFLYHILGFEIECCIYPLLYDWYFYAADSNHFSLLSLSSH